MILYQNYLLSIVHRISLQYENIYYDVPILVSTVLSGCGKKFFLVFSYRDTYRLVPLSSDSISPDSPFNVLIHSANILIQRSYQEHVVTWPKEPVPAEI
jgi:hypothetical protein